jgi:hypothetical protein
VKDTQTGVRFWTREDQARATKAAQSRQQSSKGITVALGPALLSFQRNARSSASDVRAKEKKHDKDLIL